MGFRTATRGDTAPGIGRIDSIVRWGNRWIVATASGLISTPKRRSDFSSGFLQRVRCLEFMADQLFVQLSFRF